ncbi:fucose 4-O-acetylase [Glaciihabitans arcticus]|uniref:Fucose 4-O-acetylase n=1 Tax=Glaciihabitans arcticus TaxID=2668039 RepID=A0A4Q9GN90_9MICO|nr:acyltransferase family protein [Glaciihabitans arcticus]TBN56262.1 fucose 4-O-acetylase [Glaciihabitans arcticus]
MTDAIATPTSPAPSAGRRVPLWDNARFLCVMLVVIGHGIQRQTADSNNALIVYLFIYAFHMPAFAIISGYFSKSGSPNGRQMKKVITDILIPYFIMETIWTAVQFFVEGKKSFNPTEPSWTLWFLLALGIFRLILPYLALLRWPLLWAVLFSVGVGYFDNVDSTFSLSRAIGILPFFVLGWKAREWKLVDRWRNAEKTTWWVRGLAAAVFAAWLAVLIVFIPQFREMDLRFWFFYDDSYRGLGEDQWWAGLVRLGLIALATLLSAAFLVLVPRKETWITGFGQATMYIYLLHSFILYPIRETGILRDEHSSAVWLLGMIFACIAISIVLTARPIRWLFRPIVEPKPNWLFLRSLNEPDKPGRTDPTGSRRS